MKAVRKLWITGLIAAFFVGLLGFVYLNRASDRPSDIPNIASMLPDQLPGWKTEDRPVGETEEVMRKMGEILNYDTAFLRDYQKGLVNVEVYISYWAPGKAHYRQVYGHTPDVCWIRAGWESVMQDPDYTIRLDGVDPLTLKTAQYREFKVGTEHLRTVFWQLLDGEPFTYGNFSYPPATAIFTDIFTRGFDQKPEQWFIRISANVDYSRLWRDQGFQQLMRSMANFGLVVDDKEDGVKHIVSD